MPDQQLAFAAVVRLGAGCEQRRGHDAGQDMDAVANPSARS
jgi:hypothetical protein